MLIKSNIDKGLNPFFLTQVTNVGQHLYALFFNYKCHSVPVAANVTINFHYIKQVVIFERMFKSYD